LIQERKIVQGNKEKLLYI